MFRFPTKSSPLSRLIRQRKSYSGIATADRFLADVQSCLDGGMCPTRLLGKSDASWKKALKHSRNQLVYLDDDLTIKSESFDVLRAEIEKSLPPKSAGGFDHITTTTRRDRDRDVLETGGARVDAKGPLLLQHMPFELVGRLVSVLQHTKKVLVERSAVAATAMSDDVMTLVEFGAFRISHGFRPFKWELIDPDDDRAGFHILEYEIMERSLVSVPSNVDAEILAHSRAKMATDFFRQFTKGRFDARPAMSPGVSLPVVSKACSCQKANATHVLRGDQADDIQGTGYSPRKEIDDWMKMRKLCAFKSTTKEVADGTQGDAEEGAENAPNLRQSAEGEENCGTCQFFEEGQCTLHYFEVDSSLVCDDHEPREEGDMRSIEPEVKQVVAEKQSAAIAVANLLAQELVAGNAKSLADLEQVLLKGVEGIRERRSREADELLRSVLLG